MNKKLKKIIKITFIIFISIFIILESILIFFPKQNLEEDCDYLIILGASVKNTVPSLTLKGRLDKAIEYLKKSKDDCYIVVSGGKGNDEGISEAKAMENFKYSKEKIESHSKNDIKNLNIKVVTTDFHSFRSFMLAKKNRYGNVNFYSNKSLNQFIPIYYAREFFATIKTIIFDML